MIIKVVSNTDKVFDKSIQKLRSGSYILSKLLGKWLRVYVLSNVLRNIASPQYFKKHPTGQLAKSFLVKVREIRGGAVGELFSNLIYAGVQEDGLKHDIKPKKAKALTIPTTAATTKAGRLKAWVKNKAYKSSFIGKSKSGKTALIYAVRNKKPIPIFILKKKIEKGKIPGKHYVRDAIEITKPFDEVMAKEIMDKLFG